MEIVYNRDSFLDRVYNKSKSDSSRDTAKIGLDWFDKFCLSRYQRSTDDVILEIKMNQLDVYRELDDFVQYLVKNGESGSSIRNYVSWVRRYMAYSQRVIVDPSLYRELVQMPVKRKVRDAELDHALANKVLLIVPEDIRLVLLLEATTFRRPKELCKLRPRDFDFESRPTIVSIPDMLSKNDQEGKTFTTAETTAALKDWIKRKKIGFDDYIFGDLAKAKHPVQWMDGKFRYNLKKYPELCQRTEGFKKNRLKLHIYSFKKFGWSRAAKKYGAWFADGLKGDKGVYEYERLPMEDKKAMYLELEPLLTFNNAEAVRNELQANYTEQDKRLRNIEKQMQNLTIVVNEFVKSGYEIKGIQHDAEGTIKVRFEEGEAIRSAHEKGLCGCRASKKD